MSRKSTFKRHNVMVLSEPWGKMAILMAYCALNIVLNAHTANTAIYSRWLHIGLIVFWGIFSLIMLCFAAGTLSRASFWRVLLAMIGSGTVSGAALILFNPQGFALTAVYVLSVIGMIGIVGLIPRIRRHWRYVRR